MTCSTKRFVYADNAATTAVEPVVAEAMLSCLTGAWGNPSGLYSKGREANRLLAGARERIAALLGAQPQEIYFTSSGTEADCWAIKGAALARGKRGGHIITSKIEHPAVLNSCRALEREGFEVSYLDADGRGFVSPESFREALRPDTFLAAVMLANNEIGTLQPVAEIAASCRSRGILCFTDAVQAVGSIPVNVREAGVDMLSLSGHKLGAPKGTGALYIKSGVEIGSLIDGGAQERGLRAGTENLPGIVALACALELAVEGLPDAGRIRALRDRLAEGLLRLGGTSINGSLESRLPGNLNVAFRFVRGESLLLLLDRAGICVSAGSACSSASREPSHVLLAIGCSPEEARSSLRFSLGRRNTEEDIDYILETLPPLLAALREANPLAGG